MLFSLFVVCLCAIEYSFQLKFNFTTKAELLSQLAKASHDQLVEIIYEIKSYHTLYWCNEDLQLRDLYKLDRINLVYNLEECLIDNIEQKVFNQFTGPSLDVPVYKVIKTAPWEKKVRWLINGEAFILRNVSSAKMKIGSIAMYANYLNDTFLEYKLLNMVEMYPQLQNREIFDEEIMCFSLFEYQTSLQYILSQTSINYLKQLYVNLLLYKYNFITINKQRYEYESVEYPCKKLKAILNSDSLEQLRDLIYVEMQEPKEMKLRFVDTFIQTIVKSNHSFIDYASYILNISNNKTKLREVATLSEKMYKSVSHEDKSFKFLNEYIEQMSVKNLKQYILNQMKKYPVLSLFERYDDMIRQTKAISVSSIKKILDALLHDELLRWSVNLKKYELNVGDVHTMIEHYIDDMKYVSSALIKNDILKTIMKFNIKLHNLEKILFYAEPTHNIEGQLSYYLNTFPSNILNTWLCKLLEYDKNRTSELLIEQNPFTFNKTQSIDHINNVVSIHKELYNLTKFSYYIDIHPHKNGFAYYGNVYSNFARYANVQSYQKLKRWINVFETQIKYKTRMNNLNYLYRNANAFMTKSDLVYLLIEYMESDIRLYDVEYFDKVVGMNKFHQYVHELFLDDIQILVKRLYKYYHIRMYRVKEYAFDFIQKEFELFFVDENEYDSNKGKLFIFIIASIFPELNIVNVCKGILTESKYDNYNETITLNEFEEYVEYNMDNMDDNNRNEFIYKFLRLYNASVPLSERHHYILNNLSLFEKKKILINIFTKYSHIIGKNWNFARLLEGMEFLVYEGIAPFLLRQHTNILCCLLQNIILKYSNETFISLDEFNEYTHDEQIQYIMYVINELHPELNDINKLKTMMGYRKMKDVYGMNLDKKKKQELKSYALVSEIYVRSQNKLSECGSIYKYIHDLLHEELEDYIVKCYHVTSQIIGNADDFELYSNMWDIDTFDQYLQW